MAWAMVPQGLVEEPVPDADPQGAMCLITMPTGPVTAGNVHLVAARGAAGKGWFGGLLMAGSTGLAPTAAEGPLVVSRVRSRGGG